MPNTPVEVRQGVVVYAEPAPRQPDAAPSSSERVLELFARLGTVVRVPERLLGAATAPDVGGAPAYQALLVEAQVDAGVRRGFGAELGGRARAPRR